MQLRKNKFLDQVQRLVYLQNTVSACPRNKTLYKVYRAELSVYYMAFVSIGSPHPRMMYYSGMRGSYTTTDGHIGEKQTGG